MDLRKNIHQRIRFVPICRPQKAALILAGTDYGAFTTKLILNKFIFFAHDLLNYQALAFLQQHEIWSE